MKKQFFYAAMAVALMASCTSEDSPVVDPITPDEDDKVAIQLGIDAPTVNASVGGRAVGSVGDVASTGENKWNSQQLFITMIDKSTNDVEYVKGEDGSDTATPLLGHETYTYIAPKASENNGSGNIRIYTKDNGYDATNDNGTLKYVYYPVSGTYDFLGWHIDDATNGTANGKPAVTINGTKKAVEGIVITGQQDIMGARTKEFTADNYQPAENATLNFNELIGWDFSARTARNGIQPKLKFEHQLARLKFFVKAGSESAAEYVYTPGQDGATGTWAKKADKTHTPTGATAAITTTEAMYVKAIVAKNMANKLNMDLAAQGDDGLLHVVTTADTPGTNKANFNLFSRDTDGKMKETLDLVAPAVYVNDVRNLADGEEVADVDLNKFEKGTPVGESIMFLPVANSTEDEVNLSITLQQLVKDTENETAVTEDAKYTYTLKEQSADLTVKATSVKTAEGTNATKFEAGKSYNVYITIYGFERIEVSAELTAWEMGGDVDVDVEEGVSKHTTDLIFDVKDAEDDQVTISDLSVKLFKLNDDGSETAISPKEGETAKFAVESYTTVRYEISATNYETISSYVNTESNNKTVSIKLREGQAMTITASPSGRSITPNTITVTEKGTANTVPANAQGTYNMAIGATYMIKVEAANYETKTVEHKVVNGTTSVNVEMEAEQPEEGGEDDEEEAENVQVAFTMPTDVEAATIRVAGMQDFAWTTLNNKMTFAADAASVTATIVIEGYQDITKEFVPSEAAANGITVEQNELVATPETKEVTISVTDAVNYYECSFEVKKSGSEDIIDPNEDVYSLEVGSTYVVIIKVKREEESQEYETVEREFTVGDETSVEVAFANAGGEEEGGE